jgi:UDP-galactopyranose mutase
MAELIIGCGISGAVLARLLAEAGRRVQIIDRRNHIGGNCYDRYDAKTGTFVHLYGPHIFHTDDKETWNFLSRFTDWIPYQHKVLGLVQGQFTPLPFNLNSLRSIFPKSIADKTESALLESFDFGASLGLGDLRRFESLHFLADFIEKNIIKEYTLKQWGCNVDTGRLSAVRISRDDRYFANKYQGIPSGGYTAMFERILNHKNIKVRLNTAFDKKMKYERLFWTGSADEFFGYKFGELPYRSAKITFQKLPCAKFQNAAVVNYPNNYDWTRVCEYKHFNLSEKPDTVLSFETPEPFIRGKNDPMWPVNDESAGILYQKYMKEKPENVFFLGRLGEYKYYDMDTAAISAFRLSAKIQTATR